MFNTKLIEQIKPVWAAEPKNYTGASMTAQWVSMKNYDRLGIGIITGAWAGGTAAVTLSQATTVTGTSSKSLAFTTMWVNTGAAPDTFTKTAVASSTFNLDTANLMYWIEVVSSDLDVNNSFDCVTLAVGSPGSNADLYGAFYILYNARYSQASTPTAKAN